VQINDVEERDFWAGELNPKFWKNGKLLPDVRSRLLSIALDFYNSLGVEYPVTDIWLMGSNANFNWSDVSDLDVHLFLDIPLEDQENVMRWINDERFLWNMHHDVSLKGHKVEMYVQVSGTSTFSAGIYSLVSDEWVVKPKKAIPHFDLQEVTIKVDQLISDITLLEEELESSKYGLPAKEVGDRAKFLRNHIMNMRKDSLLHGGEFAVGNLVYKVLRREGWMDKLYDIIYKAYDKTWSSNE